MSRAQRKAAEFALKAAKASSKKVAKASGNATRKVNGRTTRKDWDALAAGLDVEVTGRFNASRRVRDPRMDDLAAARDAGCRHTPVHLDKSCIK